MKAFFNYFVREPLVGKVITATLIALGIYGASIIKIDLYPRVDFGELIVNTRYTGYSADDIELLITDPIEEELESISGIKSFESTSTEGSSMIKITLDDDLRDPDGVRDDINQAIDNADLPPDLKDRPKIIDVNSNEFPIYSFAVSGGDTYADLYYYAKTLKDTLIDLPKIGSVDLDGFYEPEILIQTDSTAMAKHQISFHDIAQAVQARHIRSSSGPVKIPDTRQLILNAEFKDPAKLKTLVIRSNFSQKSVYLKDIAAIEESFERRTNYINTNGKPSITLDVIKKESADILPAIDDIKAVLAKNLPPDSVEVVLINDLSRALSKRLSVMVSNGIIGLIMIIIVLSLFMRPSVSFWVALGIPVAIAGILFLLPIAGQSINLISLIGIILIIGIIVDDGIIVSDSIVQRIEAGDDFKTAAVNGIQAVFSPVITTLLTTFLAFLPMFFMGGIIGKFVFCIPLVVTFALLFSLIEVSVGLPSHLAKPSLMKTGALLNISTARNYYIRAIAWLLHYYKTASVVFLVAMLLLGYTVFSGLKLEVFPKDASELFLVNIQYPKGTSLEENKEKTKTVESVIASIPPDEMISFKTVIGAVNTNSYERVNQENETEIAVYLTEISSRETGAGDIIQHIKPQMPDNVFFRIESGGPPVGRAIAVQIIHPDNAVRTQIADTVLATLKTITGTQDLTRSDIGLRKTSIVQADYARAAQLGVPVSAISDALVTGYTGKIVRYFNRNQESIPIRLQLRDDHQTVGQVSELLVPNNQGKLVPLDRLVSLSDGPIQPSFQHYNGDRRTTIYGEIDESLTTVATVVASLQSKLDIRQWPDATILYTGQNDDTNESVIDLLKTFVISLVGMFVLLVLLFRSLKQPLLILICIPFGVLGAGIAFVVHAKSLSFLGIIGIIGLSGVVVNDSLVMIHHLNTVVRSTDKITPLVLAEAAGTRFRPIIITSFTTVVGLLPLAYGIAGADPFLAPMPLAIGWGLFFATPLILFILPCLYQFFERHPYESV